MFGFNKQQITTGLIVVAVIWWYRTYQANKQVSNAQTLILQADPFTSGAI